MILARPKTVSSILALVGGMKSLVVAGCQECVTVCQSGGRKEVSCVAQLLEIAGKKRGFPFEIAQVTVFRQCDNECLVPLDALMEKADACISLGCGVGVQFIAERYPTVMVIPGVDTVGGGGTVMSGVWEERCAMCGECILAETTGICPVTRCAKGLLNGPCGGSVDGRCEAGTDLPCAWEMIYHRLKKQGRLDSLRRIRPPKNWAHSGSGAMRKVIREEVMPCLSALPLK